MDAVFYCQLGEPTDGIGSTWKSEIRIICHVGGLHVLDCGQPGGWVFPVKRRSARSRTDPNRQPALDEAFGDPSPSLAIAPEDQRRFLPLRARRHNFSLLV